MAAPKEKDIAGLVRERICALHLNYDELLSEASEVVIFGSRAVGVHSPASDLDLLIVTPHNNRIRSSGLDFVLLLPEEVKSPFWLGSELASHVARYGRWIKGIGEWRDSVHTSDRAIARKQKRVAAVAKNATWRWARLHPAFHLKYAVTVRRELQRLELLLDREAIPPTPTLDLVWRSEGSSPGRLIELASGICELPSLRLIQKLMQLISTEGTSEHTNI
jgi:predicted nucleotidyltransferase